MDKAPKKPMTLTFHHLLKKFKIKKWLKLRELKVTKLSKPKSIV